MIRSGFGLGLCVAVLLTVAGCERPAETSGDEQRPNLVLIVIDTLRADRLAFYGHGADTTPFLTSLAERSRLYTNAHSTSSWTAPAMASLFTSLHPFQHGMHIAKLSPDRASFEVKVLPAGAPTLAESLRARGYKTFGVTDNQNVSEKPGFDRGFDRFSSTQYESALVVNKTLMSWRDDILSSQPFFLYVHYMDPHLPYHEREPWYGQHPLAGKEGDFDDSLARYDSELRFVDQHLAELFGGFDWPADTVVVLTSDHGEEFGDHGGEQHGRTLYGEVVDVPLLMYAPSRWSGEKIDRRASLVDIAPTLLALSGHPGEPGHVGHSLLPGTADPDDDRSIYTQLIWEETPGKGKAPQESRGVIQGSFKLLDHQDQPDQLFDLRSDAGETRSVAAEHPDVVTRLSADLNEAVESAPRFEPGIARIPLDRKKVEKLKALGYAK